LDWRFEIETAACRSRESDGERARLRSVSYRGH